MAHQLTIDAASIAGGMHDGLLASAKALARRASWSAAFTRACMADIRAGRRMTAERLPDLFDRAGHQTGVGA